jgi:anaerobic glycerol-3-phosphate dehydrogenase
MPRTVHIIGAGLAGLSAAVRLIGHAARVHLYEATTQAAIEVANYVVKRLDQFSPSKPSDTNRLTRVETFCGEFVEAAFRRPLSKSEKLIFVANQFQSAPKTEDAVKRTVLLTLKSPRFLYLGLDNRQIDDFEVLL